MAKELLTRDDIVRGKKNFDAQNAYMTGTAEEQVTLPDGQKIKTRAGLEKEVKDMFPEDTVGFRVAGAHVGQVPLAQDAFLAVFGLNSNIEKLKLETPKLDCNEFAGGTRYLLENTTDFLNAPDSGHGESYFLIETMAGASGSVTQTAFSHSKNLRLHRTKAYGGSWGEWVSMGVTPKSYLTTTATSANTVVTTTGEIQRSTSSAIFKKDIADIHIADYRAALKAVRPVSYRSTDATSDRTDWSWYSFIAEELGALDKRLVQMDSVEFFEDTKEDGTTFINSRELPEGEYAANGINTNGIVALMVHINQQMLVDIEKLEDEKTQLKRRMTNLEKRMDAIDGPAAPAE